MANNNLLNKSIKDTDHLNDDDLDEEYENSQANFYLGDGVNNNDEDDDDEDEDDDDIVIDDNELSDSDIEEEESHKKAPKLIGKHSLKHDSIFKGRKMKALEEDDPDEFTTDYRHGDSLPLNQGTYLYHETREPEEYQKNMRRKEGVYNIIKYKIGLNLETNRRKPSKKDFNEYYKLVITELKPEGFSRVELFMELCYYFSDNEANMLRLLYPDNRGAIIQELKEKANVSKLLDQLDFLI
jgi:hypothetical protein